MLDVCAARPLRSEEMEEKNSWVWKGREKQLIF